MPGAPVLEVEDLVVTYRRRPDAARHDAARRSARRRGGARRAQVLTAVDGVSLVVHAGEFVALIGESGCGKTSTALGLLRLIDVERGRVTLSGRDVSTAGRRQLRRLRADMQIVFQDPYESLDPRSRVGEIVAEPLLVHGVGGSRAGRERLVREALERVGLSPSELFVDRHPHELSGGQRQRVAIAASLVLQPSLLVVDEPVSMLDVSVRAGILQLFAELRSGGLAVLMISHDLATVAQYCDRVAVMYLGRIVEEGATPNVIGHPAHPYTRALLAAVPTMQPMRRATPARLLAEDEIPDPLDIPAGCRFRPRCPLAMPSCADIDPELRDAGASGHRAACLLAGGAAVAPGAAVPHAAGGGPGAESC